jgi:TRAP-type mannitol/chloroaromatic compound transport system permease large subunit
MSDGMLGLTQLFLFLFFIMLGFPIAFTLMAMGLFFGYLAMDGRVFDLLVQRTYAVMSNDVLISVPLFVFMGYIIERANILDRLFRSLHGKREYSRLTRCGNACDLCAVCDRYGDCGRGSDTHGPARFPGHVARGL